VEGVYNELVELLGRDPTIEEILYMTIWSEYWLIQKGNEHQLIGQEAIARSYYQFCGTNGCTQDELFKFLSGYQPWFGHPGVVDENLDSLAAKLYKMLTNEYNFNLSGEEVYSQIDDILNVDEVARPLGWTDGKWDNKPSQWYGPCDVSPQGKTFGYSKTDFAIVWIGYPDQPGRYFYFFTYYQEGTNTCR
jgi:hypothetical protein